MAITKIQSGAIPAEAIDTTHIGDVGADKITGQVVSSQISDLNVTHAKLHTTMDLSSKTVTLPILSTLNITGNVGIGETSPLGKLHVKTADSGATADVSADELVIEGSGNTGISILSGASNAGSIYFGDSGTNWDGYIAYNQSSRSMTFGVAAGGGTVNIDSSGNVGIGATGRIMSGYDGNSKTLTVYDPDGSAQSGYLELASMANNNGYNAGALVFINNANSNNSAPENANSKTVAQIRAETVTSDNNAGDDAGSDLCIFTKPEAGGLQRRMTIMGSGNVGIGTNSPARILHVKDASEANIRIQGGSDYAELRVKDSDDKFSMHYGGSQVIALDSNEIFFHKNVSAIGTQGAYFNSNYSHITTTNDSPLTLNRLGNNNNLNYALDVRKDSSNAGGISVQDTWNSTKTSSFHPMSSHTYGYGLHGLNLHGYDVGRLDQSNTFNGDDQSGATMPGIVGTNPKNMKYFALHFQVVGDNVYYPFMINMNDVKGVLEIVGGDASSRGYKRWYVNFTSTAYGVYGITEAESVGGGWNSGSFSARHEAPNGNLAVGFKFSSYYSSTNVASFKAIWRAM